MLINKVNQAGSQLEKNTEAISVLSENVIKLFHLKQVSGLAEFLRTLLKLLGADGGVIYFMEGKGQVLIETVDGSMPEEEGKLIKKIKEVFSQKQAAYFSQRDSKGDISQGLLDNFSFITAPLEFESKLMGIIGFWRENESFTRDEFDMLGQLTKGIEVAMGNAYLLGEKEDMLRGLAEELVDWIEMEAPTRRGHAREVAYLAGRIAEELGLTEFEAREIQLAGLVHDIGLGGIDKLVLEKPGQLTAEERREIERHVELGKTILKKARFPERIISIVAAHHEKCDGTGYPNGLRRDQIPLGARIVAVADVFDALTHQRTYRDAQKNQKAIELIKRGVPHRFDPEVVRAFLRVYEDEFGSTFEVPLPKLH